MCQPKPGLRCAAHLRTDYERAASRLAEFDGLSDEVLQHNEKLQKDFEVARSSMQFQQHRLDLLAIMKADASRASLARDEERRQEVRDLEPKLLTEKQAEKVDATIKEYDKAWQADKAGKHTTFEQKMQYRAIEKKGKKAKQRLAENAETTAAISKLEGQLFTETRTANEQWVIGHEEHMLSSYDEAELASLREEAEARNAAGLYLSSTRKPLPEAYEQQVKTLRLIQREGLSTTHKDMEPDSPRVLSIEAKQRDVAAALSRAEEALARGEVSDPEQKPLQAAKADTADRKPKRARAERTVAAPSAPAVTQQPLPPLPAIPTPEQQAAEKRAEQMRKNRELLTAPAPEPEQQAPAAPPAARPQAAPVAPLIREGGERRTPSASPVTTTQPTGFTPPPVSALKPSSPLPSPQLVERPAVAPMRPASSPASMDTEQPNALKRFLAFLQGGGQK